MTNIWLVVLILFDFKQLVLSGIINVEIPNAMVECKIENYRTRHKCVMNIYKHGTDWIKSNDKDIQLRLQQDFYWHPNKRVRSECRTLSETERQELWDAVNALKQDIVSHS